jgi:hypothetical protein
MLYMNEAFWLCRLVSMSANLRNRDRKHEQNNDCGTTAERQVLYKSVFEILMLGAQFMKK